ncbi:MAG: ATP-binding protein [Thermodesulfobacteriota bacterium]
MTRRRSATHVQKRLEAVLRLSQLLGTSLRLTDVLDNAMRGLEEALSAGASSVYEVDYQAGELFFRHARGAKADRLLEKRIKIGEGVAGWVAQTGEPKIVEKTANEELFSDRLDRETGYRTRSMLSVPLVAKGTVIGVIQLLNKEGDGVFTQDDLELAQIMAGPIAVALENAKLYSRLEEKHLETAEELRATQERLIRTERQAALSGLAHGIAHQIRNPAMSIGGFARRILEKTLPDQESIRRYAQVIVEENQKLEELVRQVRFLIELEPEMVPAEINPVVEKALAQSGLAPETFSFEPGANLPRLFLDPGLMATALAEVLKNAREAGAGRINVRTYVQGENVCLETTDNGPGFEAEDLSAVLDPFFSTRAHSLGLGLSVTHRILQEHGGEIELKNNPEGGATVTLRLPLSRRPE